MRLLAALVVFACAPLTALAQGEPPNPVAAAPTADWNIGGGLGYGMSVGYFSTGPTPPSSVAEFLPGAAASLERRLSSRTWLAFGVTGSFLRRRDDVAPGASGWTRADVQQLFVTAGLRHVLTGSAAPVDVSLLVLAESGSVRREYRGWFSAKERGWLAGAELGIAVDRELTPGLFLRVATPLVAARYSEGRVEGLGEPVRTGSTLTASVFIAPRLELRLAF